MLRTTLLVICGYLLFTSGINATTHSGIAKLSEIAHGIQVDPNFISVSGISSGGYMAVQFHVAFSSDIMGAGIIAGGPFYCANADLDIALTSCSTQPELINISELVAITYSTAATLTIDAPSNLANDKVYLFSGLEDTVVHQGVMKKLQTYYEHFTSSSNIKAVFNYSAEHSFVTDSFGSPCDYLGSPYINNCGIDSSFEILSQIYNGNITRGTGSPTGNLDNLLEFSQEEYFVDVPEDVGMNPTGFVYIPTRCRNDTKACSKLHVAFHGCLQTSQLINDTFVGYAGYNRHAEANNIIILYPQTHTNELNPKACYDWWGYTGADYASKLGVQMAGIKAMVNHFLAA